MAPKRSSHHANVQSSDCYLLGLPLELLDNVLARLSGEDLRATRLTCKILAYAGSEYLMEEIHLIYKLDRFERLESIAQHPVVSRKITSLYYQADRLKVHRKRAGWEEERQVPYSRKELDAIIADSSLDIAQRGAKMTDKGNYSRRELHAAYRAYVNYIEEQQRVEMQALDFDYLTICFQACPNLDRVVLEVEYGPRGEQEMLRRAFVDAHVHPFGDRVLASAGNGQLYNLLRAAEAAKRKLRELTAGEIGHKLFRRSNPDFPLLKRAVGSLHTLRLSINYLDIETRFGDHVSDLEHDDEDLNDYDGEDPQQVFYSSTKDVFDGGAVHEVLASAQQLRHLTLTLLEARDEPVADFWSVFQLTTWSSLRHFNISTILASENDLVAFILRHSDTLRSMTLAFIDLTLGSWQSTFERIAGQLPNIKRVRLGGYLTCGGRPGEYDFYNADSGVQGVFSDALERYIMRGGQYPDYDEMMDNIDWRDPNLRDNNANNDEREYSVVSFEDDELDVHMIISF